MGGVFLERDDLVVVPVNDKNRNAGLGKRIDFGYRVVLIQRIRQFRFSKSVSWGRSFESRVGGKVEYRIDAGDSRNSLRMAYRPTARPKSTTASS